MTAGTLPEYDADRVARDGERAIVIGAGVAGLLTARVLADAFEDVVVLDRDSLPDDGEPRRGVPQGVHAHALLAGGRTAISVPSWDV